MDSQNQENILKQAGLSEEQAITYEALLERGPQKASSLAEWTGIKRGLTYKVLEQLENMGLVEKKGGEGTVAVFYPNHPSMLLDKMDRDKKNMDLAKEIVEAGLGNLTSKYNLLSGKPSVRFFEGEEGIKAVLNDTLSTKSEILTYLDIEIVEKYFKTINEEYVRNREKKDIPKKLLVLKNDYSQKFFTNKYNENQKYFEITNLRFVNSQINGIEAALQIYDGKIGIITVSEKNLIGVIIEDKRIADLMRSIFEALYMVSPKFEDGKIIN